KQPDFGLSLGAIGFLNRAETGKDLLVCLFPNIAGIQQKQVRLRGIFGGFITQLDERPGNLFGIMVIHLTSEGLYEEFLLFHNVSTQILSTSRRPSKVLQRASKRFQSSVHR